MSAPFDETLLKEMDRMGRIHAPGAVGMRVAVELIHMQALLGFLQDAIIAQLFLARSEGSRNTLFFCSSSAILVDMGHYQEIRVPSNYKYFIL